MRTRNKKVGVRELRQNLSVYLRQVKKGKVLEVLERGRPVAALVPLPETASARERLVASGRATAPVGPVLELGKPTGRRYSTNLTESLRKVRTDRL